MVGFTGGILHASAKAQGRDDLDQLAACLPADPGCGTRPELVAVRTNAADVRTAAFALYGVSGATLVIGVALVVHDRPRKPMIDPSVALVPVVRGDVTGVAAAGRF